MQYSPIGNPRFYAKAEPYSLTRIASAAGGVTDRVSGTFDGVAPLQVAGPTQVSFLSNRQYAPLLKDTRAGAVLLQVDLADRVPVGTAAIVLKDPYEGWARVAALFHPAPPLHPGIDQRALVAPSASVDPSAEIGPLCYVAEGAQIGARCRIGPFTSIGAGVVIGPDCQIGAHVTISHAILGARISLHPGVRVGQEGFGFARTATGFLTIPHLALVRIEDDVEIGANSTIDRGSVQDTVIGAGSRLDNLVQIGHNVQIGRCCVIVAQVGLAGSTVLEDFVQIGGQAAVAGHLRVGKAARIAAQAGVISDVPPNTALAGSPARPRGEFFRQIAVLKRLAGRTFTVGAHPSQRSGREV